MDANQGITLDEYMNTLLGLMKICYNRFIQTPKYFTWIRYFLFQNNLN